MRKALVVGIDYYGKTSGLSGCVNDAHAVNNVLERNSDNSLNFSVKLLCGTDSANPVGRSELRQHVRDLFADDSEIALFYFSGHGHIEMTGGYICGSDCRTGDDGMLLIDVLTWANESKAKNKIVVLDSCHSGFAGTPPTSPRIAELTEGLTILTASTAEQYAIEENGGGIFTNLFVDALNGGAGNLVGDVTPGSVYAYIDQSLGPWEQRPVFKTNVKSFVSLRKVQPPISLTDLRRLAEFFPTPGFEFRLDPSFEPERPTPDPGNLPPPNPANTWKFDVLQKYNRVNLVIPVGAPHMWHAAIGSKSCKLTVLGKHYRRLVERNLI